MEAARQQLCTAGVQVMTCAELTACLGAVPVSPRFGSHWDALVLDPYAAELGTRRLRRFGHFVYNTADRTATPMPHRAFVQPDGSNPLYVGCDRHFAGLTEEFSHDPMLGKLLALLGALVSELDDVGEWHAKVTPFRVFASPGAGGNPTPEGLHRDGVTLVSSLLIDRHNVVGGSSLVYDLDGVRLLKTTLRKSGTLLLGDDRKTLHGVTRIQPRDPGAAGWRDVLVITFAPSAPADRLRRR